MKQLVIYDSTLRDGAQALGISYTVEDKLRIVDRLDRLGVHYIEAGNPGSNPKDLEFFRRAANLKLRRAKIIAFGSTRRAGVRVEDDTQVNSLLTAGTTAVAVFGKSWDWQVTDILKTTLDENLKMIADTIRYFKSHGMEVVYDAEHFFDGYQANPEYAMSSLRAAAEAGADCLCLCDTKGFSLPDEIFTMTDMVVRAFPGVSVGIHCHNDNGMGVAGSIMAVRAGAVQIQGTINGFGERCGNANLCTIIPNLQLRMNYRCIPDESMPLMTPTARYVSEVANVIHDERAPFVGNAAFAHKAGMHADAVNKHAAAYESLDPETVGNKRIFLMSEVAGRGAVLNIVREIDPNISKDSPETGMVLQRLKELEHEGYQYEGAECSFELVIRRILGKHREFFSLGEFKVVVNEPAHNNMNSTAMIKIWVDGEEEVTAAEGDGPVNAMDKALRKALKRFYPEIEEMKLSDYKVRVLDSKSASAAKVRVLIESTDGENLWSTVGVSTDIVDASYKALVDSIEYRLLGSRGL